MSGFSREWQCPPAEAPEMRKIGWLDEAAQEGLRWQESQRGFKDWRKGLEIIAGEEGLGQLLEYRSRISGRRLKTNIRVMIAGMANIRPMWGYHAAKAMAGYASVLNRTARALYLEGFWDQAIKEALAYAAATCTGWIRPVYLRDQMGRGRGKIKLLTYGMPCVLPVQLPSSGDWQEAYAVTLLDEIPIYEAHAKWPAFQDRLSPTQSRYWYSRDVRSAAKQNRWKRAMSMFRKRDVDEGTDQYIPIRWTTLIDLRINESKEMIRMGQPGSPWEYTVPFYGQEIPDGIGGMRRADENDSRLYPNRRLMISSENCCMYDGPAFNWHGQLDLIPFCLDKWPWEPMGFSAVRDGWENQKAIDEIDRGVMDKVRALLNLSLGYPIGGVTRSDAEGFDPFEPRARIGYDEEVVDKPFQLPVPIEVYRVEPEILQFRETLSNELDFQTQTRDIMELGKAQALGKGMDQLEALIAANGPLVRDMSRSMEAGLGRVGEQVGWLIPQYMTTSRLIQYAEPETLDMQVFDYNPSSLIPSHLPDDAAYDAEQNPLPSKYSLLERMRWFAGNVKFVLMPHSVHEITQMTHRLMLIQLRQRNYPVSAATVMESCEVQDVVRPEGNSEQERFWAEKEDELAHMVRMKGVLAGLGMDPAMAEQGPAEMGTTSQGGRPATFATAPTLEQKGDGRPLISTSE